MSSPEELIAIQNELDARAATLDGVKKDLRVRFYPDSALDPALARLMQIHGDLALVLVYDHPAMLITVPHEHVLRWGVPLEDLRDLALANLLAELRPEVQEIGGGLFGLASEHYCTTSLLLALGEFATLHPAKGALVALPTRHVALFHPIADVEAAVQAVNALIGATGHFAATGPGTISDQMWWVRGETWTHLPVVRGDKVDFTPPNEFVELLNDLASGDGPN